jgi:photosystem II stability/assembly factor-like uncharacterized protein
MLLLSSLLLWMLLPWAGYAQAVEPEDRGRPGAKRAATIASFPGPNTIQALAVDASGNILVAGTTSSPDFPIANALQPTMGEARIIASTDGGATWTNVGNPPVDVFSVAPNPLNPQVLLASAIPGVYKSTDGGRTWRAVYQSPTKPYSCLGSVVVDPANPLHAAAWVSDGSFDGVLVRSVDGGESWTKTGIVGSCFSAATGNFGNDELWADPARSGALLVVDSRWSLLISRDWGLTFQPLPLPGRSPIVTNVALDPSKPGSLYIATYASGAFVGGLFFSSDFGATWVTKTWLNPSPSNIACNISAITVDPNHSNTVVASGCGMYISTDGGASWKPVPRSDAFYPGTPLILSRQCPGGGNVIALGILPNTAPPATELIGSTPDYGLTWSTRQVSNVTSLVSSGCTIYAVRTLASDAFIAKLAPDGTMLWATFLGGSNADAPVALTVDAQGNAYVSGNTASPDFPSTAPVLGVFGRTNAFVTKFSPDGTLLYSVVLGTGNIGGTVAVAVDRQQSAYLIGTTGSPQFPVTPGALVATLDNWATTGFLLKLSPAGALSYATYLGSAYTYASGIILDAQNQPILAGTGPVPGSGPLPLGTVSGYVAQLDAVATQVLRSVQLPTGIGAIAADPGGNILVAGTSGGICGASFLTKLAAVDWHPIYNVPSLAPCEVALALAVDGDGAIYVAADTLEGWPLYRATLQQPACLYYTPYPHGNGVDGSALAKLSPDGSTIELGTYLEGCGVPVLAIASDGPVYVGLSSLSNSPPWPLISESIDSPLAPFAAVLKLEPRLAARGRIDLPR